MITPALMETLLSVADGESTAEMAERLGITPNTVHGRRFALVDALDARNITHAVALAYHKGILVPPQRTR